jgi:hypothetical protein
MRYIAGRLQGNKRDVDCYDGRRIVLKQGMS